MVQVRQSKQPQYLGSGNFQLENILKNRTVGLEKASISQYPCFIEVTSLRLLSS